MRRAGLAVSLALPMTLACAPEPTPGVFPDRDAPASDAPDAGDGGGGGGDTAGGAFTGQWAMVTEWSTCVKVVDELETRAWRLLHVAMTQEGGRLKEERTLCELRLSPILGLATVVPQPLIDAHPKMQLESVLLGQGAGAAYYSGFEVQRFGIEFKDLLGDPMPGKADTTDPRLVDTEADGKPGATFHVGPSCSIHIAQRELGALSGLVQADGSVRGGGVHLTEQTVFSSTKPICGQAFSTRPNDAHNRFVMVRAEGYDSDGDGAVSCAELRAQGEAIAKQSPADDAVCAPGG